METHQFISCLKWTAEILCSRTTMEKTPFCLLWHRVCLSGCEGADTGATAWELLVSRQTTPQQMMIPASKGRSRTPYSPRNLHTASQSHHQNLRDLPKTNTSSGHSVLTISQKVEKHFHFGQRADACEVCALRVTGLRRLLPGSFCSGQHPVAEAIMWPPATAAFCVDVLPVLWKRRNHSDTAKRLSNNSSCLHHMYTAAAAAASATVRKVKGPFPDAIQLWRVEGQYLTHNTLLYIFLTGS